MKLHYWIWLFFLQAAWTSSYAAMKVALEDMPVSIVVFLRFAVVSTFFFFYWLVKGFPRFSRRDFLLVAAVGFLDFAVAPLLQVRSLTYTQSIDVSILIAIEPMLTVCVAAIFLRERPARSTVFALLVSTLGMFILSGAFDAISGSLSKLRLFGNLIFLLSLVFEASMTVSGRALTQRYSPMSLMGAMLVCGFVGVVALNFPTILQMNYGNISIKGWSAIFWLSFAASIFGYTSWFWLVKRVPANHIVLSLFLQPLLGTFIGWFFLGESVAIETFIGACLICASLAWWQMVQNRKQPAVST